MTDQSPMTRRQTRWAHWFAALILFLALFPASAANCATGARACPMAAAHSRCSCCCPTSVGGAALTGRACRGAQAIPAPPARLVRNETPGDRGIAGAYPAVPGDPVTSIAHVVPPGLV